MAEWKVVERGATMVERKVAKTGAMADSKAAVMAEKLVA